MPAPPDFARHQPSHPACAWRECQPRGRLAEPACQHSVFSPVTRSEVQSLRESTRPHREFDDLKVYYYQKVSDQDRITKSLDAARIPYHKTRASLPEKFEVSAIACGKDVPIESVRRLATVLTKSGVAIRAILPFRDATIKPGRIELVSLSTNAKALEAITTPPLTLEQIAGIRDCRWFQNR